MPIKKILEVGQIHLLTPATHDIMQYLLYDRDFIVHEIKIKKSALGKVGEAVKLGKIPIF